MATCRQPGGPSVYRQLSLTCMGWSEGPPQEPHYYHTEGGGCICHRSPFVNSLTMRYSSSGCTSGEPRLARSGTDGPAHRESCGASSSGICGCTQWGAGSILVTAPEKEKAVPIFTEVLTQFYLLTLQLRTGSRGLYSNSQGADPALAGLSTAREQSGGTTNIQGRLSSLQHQIHPLSRR